MMDRKPTKCRPLSTLHRTEHGGALSIQASKAIKTGSYGGLRWGGRRVLNPPPVPDSPSLSLKIRHLQKSKGLSGPLIGIPPNKTPHKTRTGELL